MAKNTRPTLSRKDIMASVSEMNDITKTDAEKATIAVFDTIRTALEEGNNVAIHEFGVFSIKDVPARQGRNPKTGESMEIPACCKLVFKPAAAFKRNIKEM